MSKTSKTITALSVAVTVLFAVALLHDLVRYVRPISLYMLPLVLIALAIAGYFAPLIVALFRKVPNVGSIAVINVFLGWTLIGWVVALAMAFRTVPSRQQQPYT